MSEEFKALILGIIQGLTEFLPVSSSGHLELANYIFGADAIPKEQALMTLTLHVATVVATLLVFRRDISRILQGVFRREPEQLRFASFIIISMIPAVFIGLLFEDAIDALFSSNIILVSSMLLLTGVWLLLADRRHGEGRPMIKGDAVLIGLAQAIAVLPGISRSGATIGSALFLKNRREEAARFSFLMVIPLILGKVFLDLIQGDYSHTHISKSALIIGFFAALISGYFACKWMIGIVKKARLSYFGWYCLIIGILGWAWIMMRG